MTAPLEGDLVFDTEALVAYFAGERGADVTNEAFNRLIDGGNRGFLHDVNAAELWYVIRRHIDAGTADDHVSWLQEEVPVTFVSTRQTWQKAASIKASHPVSLADAFALATASVKGCPVLAGIDGELDAGDEIGVDVHRIRPDE